MPILATERFSEVLQPLVNIGAVSTSGATNSSWVDVSNCSRFAAIIITGLIAAGGTMNAKLTQATSSGGAGAKDITGKAIAALADTADNQNFIIDVRADELDVNGGFKFVRIELTGAVAASLIAAILLGAPAQLPATQTNWTQAIN